MPPQLEADESGLVHLAPIEECLRKAQSTCDEAKGC